MNKIELFQKYNLMNEQKNKLFDRKYQKNGFEKHQVKNSVILSYRVKISFVVMDL